MWFFMYVCYIMSLVTLAALLTGLAQSFFDFTVVHAHHVTFMILTSILYCFTETLVIFFFVGTGVSIKEYTQEHKLPPDYHRRSIEVKREVYPPLMLNLLFMIVLFVLVGAVDTHHVPKGLYQGIFVGCIVHYLYVKGIQNRSFRKNTQIILEMSGIENALTQSAHTKAA